MSGTPHNLAEFLAASAKLVDEELDRLIPAAEVPPQRLHEAIRWSVFAGGKRFRPALLLAAGMVFGAEERKLLRTAAAFEMVHTYSLIHDDLPAMDDDDLRRGRATCHVRFDDATAILAGDALQALAFQAIARDGLLSPETRAELIALLAAAAGTPGGMVAGQQLDLEAEGRGGSSSIEDIEKIHRSKTGALISAAAESGALIAGASEEEAAVIRRYGAQIGLLFQITDDLLDITQSTRTLGKTAGKDESAEKATYPALLGPEATRELAGRTCREAIRGLDALGGEARLLVEIAEFILNRTR